MATDPLEVVLNHHQPWYDSFDQNSDSWGCKCNHKTGYRSAEEVVKNHIVPLIRRASAKSPLDLTSPDQRTRLQPGLRQNRNEVPPPPDFWESLDAHVRVLQKQNLRQTAAFLCLYEQERVRQNVAIHNLEDQMKQLIEQSAMMGQVRAKLERAGFDLDVILATEDLFGDHEQHSNITYCQHGNDMQQNCGPCGRR